MGCNASVLPDGDGIESLPWLPNDNDKHWASHKHFSGHVQPHQRVCRLLINQEAIWNKISGGAAETLPYPVEAGAKEAADHKHFSGHLQPHQRVLRFSINQEAIWNKLSGGTVECLPYPAEAASKEAAESKHFLAGGQVQPHQRELRMLINQEAIWNKLSGGTVESMPYPADDNCRAIACRVNLAQSRECRMWINQEAIFNKLPATAGDAPCSPLDHERLLAK